MEYISTRDHTHRVSSAQAIVSGLAPDGGLYIPETIPTISPRDIELMSKMDYMGLCTEVMSRFLTDFLKEELSEYIQKAYSGKKFGPIAVAPVVTLDPASDAHVLELFHGPTCAFKDFALQLLPHLLTASLKKTGENKTAVVLVATSGDTGKAALEGFADIPGTRICVFYPEGGTSAIQRLQMTTQQGENVLVLAIRGNFDDAQSGVKKIFANHEFAQTIAENGFFLTSANSINWGRLAPQIAYYFSAYCQLVKRGKLRMGRKINVVVPTGNFGNILAAYYAKCAGLPIQKLICASNTNNVLTDFITTGVYDRNRSFHRTASPSMDILVSSNLERLLYLMLAKENQADADIRLRDMMASLDAEGRYEIGPDLLKLLQKDFEAGYANDGQTFQSIFDAYRSCNYLCDTHTAVAVKVYQDYVSRTGDRTTAVIASTASPFKFAGDVLSSAFRAHIPNDEFERIETLTKLSRLKAPHSLAALRYAEERFSMTIDADKMQDELLMWLR